MPDAYGDQNPQVELGNGLKTRYFKHTAIVEEIIADKNTSAVNSQYITQQAFLKSVIGQKVQDPATIKVEELTEEEYQEHYAAKRRAAAKAREEQANA